MSVAPLRPARLAAVAVAAALLLVDAMGICCLLVNPEAWLGGVKLNGWEALRVYLPLFASEAAVEALALWLLLRGGCVFASLLLLASGGLHLQDWVLAGGPLPLWEAVAAAVAGLLGLLGCGAEKPLAAVEPRGG